MGKLGKFTSQLASSLINRPSSRTERQQGTESSEEIERIKQRVSGMSLEEYNNYYSSELPSQYREYFTSPSTLYAERNKIISENIDILEKQAEYYNKMYRKYIDKKNRASGKKRNEYDIRAEFYLEQRDSLKSQGIALAKEGFTADSIRDLIRVASSKERREKERILASRKDLKEIQYLPSKEARYIEIETSKGKTGYIKQEQEGREYTFKLDKPLLPEGVEPSDLKNIQSSPSGLLKPIQKEKAYAIAYNRALSIDSEGNKRITEKPVVYGSEGVIEFIQNNQEAIEQNEKEEIEKIRAEIYNQMFPLGITETEVKTAYPNVYGEYLALSGDTEKMNQISKDLQLIYSEREWYNANPDKLKSQLSIKDIENAINGKGISGFLLSKTFENVAIDRKRIETELIKLYPEGKVGGTIAKLDSYGQIGKAVARTIAYDFSVGLIEIPTNVAKYTGKGLALGSTIVNPEKADIYFSSEQKISNAMDSTNKWLRDTYLYSGGDSSPFGEAYSSAIKGKGVQNLASASEIAIITGSLAKMGLAKISQISDDVSKYGWKELYPSRWNKNKNTELLKEWQISEGSVLSENEILRVNKKFAGSVLSSLNEIEKSAKLRTIKPAKYEQIYEIYNPKTGKRVRAYGTSEVLGSGSIENLNYLLNIEQKLRIPTFAKTDYNLVSSFKAPDIKIPKYKFVKEEYARIGKITNIANIKGLNVQEAEEILNFASIPKDKVTSIYESDLVSKKVTDFLAFRKKPLKIKSNEYGTGFLATMYKVDKLPSNSKEIDLILKNLYKTGVEPELFVSKPVKTSMQSRTTKTIEQEIKELLNLDLGILSPFSKSKSSLTYSRGLSEVDVFKVSKQYEGALKFNPETEFNKLNFKEADIYTINRKDEATGFINSIFKAESSGKVPIFFKARDLNIKTELNFMKPLPETALPKKLPKNPANSVANTIKDSASKINNILDKFTKPKVKESHFNQAISSINERKAIEQIWRDTQANKEAIEYTDMLDSLMPSSYGESRAVAGILNTKLNIPTNIGTQNLKLGSTSKIGNIEKVGNLLNNALLGRGKLNLKNIERQNSKLRENSRLGESSKIEQALNQIQRSAIKTKTIQRTKTRTKTLSKSITALKLPSSAYNTPKRPNIRKTIIPFKLPDFDEEPIQKKKKLTEAKIKKLMTLRYVQDFTSKILNLKPKTIKKKDLAKYIQTRTPLSIRRALKVK